MIVSICNKMHSSLLNNFVNINNETSKTQMLLKAAINCAYIMTCLGSTRHKRVIFYVEV